ncbi:sigma-70 family RNA polymerase sigma factor [Saccharibacillus sp. CPCC 101409]|uniref:RNA polymerase sigma factor n=1 Tax=Saccharibacillus sp. CPCC 101409 TaxID=3058041 RepID=UPI002670FBB3|nr:sigma-70 family RNA polymerase sigma factor [Saccharibacillus sp. CPCC 101409]MDO3409658.1 sigma-70 family RNA polymerase sigma factor [Saccharibacillus sp. CPCC 101409]
MIRRILRGDRDAFRELVDAYRQPVFRIAFSVLRSEKDAEDAAQEVFIQIHKSLPDYRSQGFKTWISRIALNKAIDFKRKQNRRREDLYDSEPALLQAPSGEEAPLTRILRQERAEEIKRRMMEMPGGHREVIEAFYFQGKNYEQISAELHVTVKTVESKLYRARMWIRQHWREEEWL